MNKEKCYINFWLAIIDKEWGKHKNALRIQNTLMNRYLNKLLVNSLTKDEESKGPKGKSK